MNSGLLWLSRAEETVISVNHNAAESGNSLKWKVVYDTRWALLSQLISYRKSD